MKNKNILIVVAVLVIAIIASSELSVSTNSTSVSTNSTSVSTKTGTINGTSISLSSGQQILNLPQPKKGEAIMFVGRLVDDPSSFRDIQPFVVETQIVTKYPLLQGAMKEADSLFENQTIFHNNPEPYTAREIVKPNPNYIGKIPTQLAMAIISDNDFHFIQLPTPAGAADTNNYSTSIRIGNVVYSIGITYT